MFLTNNTSSKQHFNAEDIYYLKISDNYSNDVVKIVDKLISCKFTKYQRGSYSMQSSTFMYVYEEGIKTWFWQKYDQTPYILKIIVMKTHQSLFVPIVVVKSRETGKEIDRLNVPERHLKLIDRVVDRNLNRLVDEGLFVVSKDKRIKV